MKKQHEVINPNDILVEDRMRKDYGDITELANSIRENGLIQPIVLSHTFFSNPGDPGPQPRMKLVAGGRRLAAIKLLKWGNLIHGEHYLVRGEDESTPEGKLRLGAIELEENLRRKEMTWTEQVEGKQRLLELMQSIHGTTGAGRPSGREAAAGSVDGFGVRKLATMLGESAALTSMDLQLATIVRAMPELAKQESKASARRIGTINLALHHIKTQQELQSAVKRAVMTVTPPMVKEADGTVHFIESLSDDPPRQERYKLYHDDWKSNIYLIPDGSIDLVYTDLPYGVDLDKMGATENVSAHGGAISYSDSRDAIVSDLANLATEAFRVLKPHRFGVFFFGFNYYSDLISALTSAGFSVNPIPVVWLKHQQFTQQPNCRYANGYEQALIVMKGQPKFIRPGQANIVDVPGVSTVSRFQVAQQPVELVKRFIEDMTLPKSGARILDFYAGTGTTGGAALELGQFPILFERMEDQCLLAKNRMEQVLKTSKLKSTTSTK
jgi:DNA modification methylase